MKLSNLLQSVAQSTASIDGVRWYPVRPKTAENTFLLPRIKAALRVLAGTSDAVEWDYPTDRKAHNAVYALCGPFTSPQASKPLTDEQIDRAIAELGLNYLADAANNRAVLRELCRKAAHGIKGNT